MKEKSRFKGVACLTGRDAMVEATARKWTPKKNQVVRKVMRK